MDLGLQGKSVLVTASSDGLGKATALEFAREGAKVMMLSKSVDKLKAAQEEIRAATGNEPQFVAGDLTNYDDVKKAIAETAGRYGGIYALVNNCGGPPAGPFEQFDDALWQKAFELNLLSYVRSIREVLPWMKQQGEGRIVNFTSSAVKQVIDNLILSNTFRMGVVGLTKTLSQELGKYNILINVMGPGRIGTKRIEYLDQITAEKEGLSAEELQKKFYQAIPLGRYGVPAEYARLAVFLCSAANTYITGQTVLVDGGMTKAF